MPTVRLTQPFVDSLVLSEGKKTDMFWDEELKGFGLRIWDTGRRSFIVQYRTGGRQPRLKVGDAFKLTAGEARRRAKTLLAQVELGRDPANEKAEKRLAEKDQFRVIAAQYLDAKTNGPNKVRMRSLVEYRRHLMVNVKPLHRHPIQSITRRMVASCLMEVEKRGAVTAERTRTTLMAFFGWCMRQGFLEVNPALNTGEPYKAPPRKRVLSNDELREVWLACEDDDFGRIVRLLILTGCRRREIGSLRWDELTGDCTVATLREMRTKNGEIFVLRMPPQASRIIRGALKREGRPHVFGWGRNGFDNFSFGKQRLDERILAARREQDSEAPEMAAWVLHDLRRSFRTGLGNLKIPPHIAELALNHVGPKAGIGRVYDQSDYSDEIAEALIKWARHVDNIVHFREPLRAVS